MNKPHVVVIGGGVIGASCAYHLAKKGAAVTLLEKRYFGAGASGCSAAMLECQTHAYRGDPFLTLARASLERFPGLHKELLDLTSIDFEYDPCGIVNLAMSEDDAHFYRSCVESQKTLGLRARWMEPEDVEQNFPQINPEYHGAAYYLDDGQINGEVFLNALLEGVRLCGGELRDNLGPVGLAFTPKGICAVTGEKLYPADAYVVAAGAWSNEVLGNMFLPGVSPVRGQLIFYSTPPKYVPAPIFTKNHGYVVSKSSYTLVGTTVEEVGFDDGTTDQALVGLVKKGQFLVPGLSRQALRGASAGLRPQSPDDLPLIGPVPTKPNVFLATGHFRNGMLLAPITGEIISSLVLKEKPPLDIEPFLPDRVHQL